jgi:hypothetical protein
MIFFILIHIMVSTLLAYTFAILTGGLAPWSSTLSLVVGALFARLSYKKLRVGLEDFSIKTFKPDVSGALEFLLLVFIGFAAYKHFAWMLYFSDGQWKTLSLNNYGDLPLHINYIRYFAQGAKFPPLNPSFAADYLRYPLGMDLYNSLWESIGTYTPAHIFITGMVTFAITFIALRAWGGWIAVGGFFLNGGLLGYEILHGYRPNAAAANALAWKNIFLTVFITQRGILFAVPAGILLLQFARRVFRGELSPTKLQLQIFGALWGSLALFHLHAFFILSVIIAALAIIYFSKPAMKRAVTLALWAVPLGTLFTLYSTSFFQKASIAHWRLGWMVQNEGFSTFMIFNFGPWLLLIIAVGAGLVFLRKKDILKEYILAIALFALFMNLMLAPWEWDNIKVLIWPYILILGAANIVIKALPPKARFLEVALAVLLLFSGTMMVARTLDSAREAPAMISLEAVAKAKGLTKNIPLSAIFAAAPSHDHALAYMGRLRVLGYEGHNWSHGINTLTQTADLEKLMGAHDDWRGAARRLKATHIFWGPHEEMKFGPMPEELKKNSTRVATVPGYEVYELPH